MRWSRYYLFTTREEPGRRRGGEPRLMVRAGMIRKLAAGIYIYLPLGCAASQKLETIVRREMSAPAASSCSMPAIQPAELWQESGRWEQYGKELLRIKDRHEREFCFGPTHEEVVTDLVRARRASSYRQLPINLYQIQTKFRDEVRPRFGLMRGREFLMKDAYSFHADRSESLDETYDGDVRGLPRASSTPAGSTTSWSRPTPAPSAARRRTSSWCWPRPARARSCAAAPAATPPTSRRRRRRARRRRRPASAAGAGTAARGRRRRACARSRRSARFLGLEPRAAGQDADLRRRRRAGRGRRPRRSRGQRDQAQQRPRRAARCALADDATVRARDRRADRLRRSGRAAARACALLADQSHARPAATSSPAPTRPTPTSSACVWGRDAAPPTFADLRAVRGGDPCPRCGTAARGAPRHRGRPHLQARHQVLRGDGRDLPRRGRRRASDHHGLLRPRHRPHRRRRDRAEPRRRTASSGRCRSRRSRCCSCRSTRKDEAVREAAERALRRAASTRASTCSSTTATSGPASSSRTPT